MNPHVVKSCAGRQKLFCLALECLDAPSDVFLLQWFQIFFGFRLGGCVIVGLRVVLHNLVESFSETANELLHLYGLTIV